MRTAKEILEDLNLCARAWEPDVHLLGNVTAAEISFAIGDITDHMACLLDALGYACESPPRGCECSGCSLAREASEAVWGDI